MLELDFYKAFQLSTIKKCIYKSVACMVSFHARTCNKFSSFYAAISYFKIKVGSVILKFQLMRTILK